MLRTSLGTFRSVPRLPALPRWAFQSGPARIGVRSIAHQHASSAVLSQLRAASRWTTSQALKSRPAPLRSAFRPPPRRTFHSSRARRSDARSNQGAKSTKDAVDDRSISGRLKKLSREYGWTAVGVYLGLSVLDFPFCFLLVRWLGTDRIAEAEHFVVSNVSKVIPRGVKDMWAEYRQSPQKAEHDPVGNDNAGENADLAGWGVKAAQQRNKEEASLATQLALAYAVHKSFIFLRVPLTAAVLPKVVKVLRSWGWQIGKRTSKI